jgi:hypothetical protein
MARKLGPNEHVRYVPDHKSFGAWIMSEEMRDLVAPVAVKIAVTATATAPEPSSDTRPEAAHKAVYTTDKHAGSTIVGGNARVVLRVEGDGEAAQRAEFGYEEGGEERFYNLRRAAARYGNWKRRDDG